MPITIAARRAFVVALLTLPLLRSDLPTGRELPAPSKRAVEHARVRPLEPLTRQLVDDAQARSPTIRDLVNRIERSDVVVYATCDVDDGSRPHGRMSFHAVAGGFRYLVMRLRAGLSRSEHVATFGHELQHAVEIANMPSIVDDASLARAYRQIGFLNARSGNSLAFETVAALQVGDRVRREFVAASERDPCDRATREPRVIASPRATSVVD